MRAKHHGCTREHFEDMSEVRDWMWTPLLEIVLACSPCGGDTSVRPSDFGRYFPGWCDTLGCPNDLLSLSRVADRTALPKN